MTGTHPDEIEAPAPDADWKLLVSLDGLAVVLLGAVVCLGLGGAVAGIWPNLGANPLEVAGSIPLFERLASGLNWAAPDVGLMLLGAVGALALPRLAWADPNVSGVRRARWLLRLTAVIAGVVSAAALADFINLVWLPGEGLQGGAASFQAPGAALSAAGFLLAGAASVLSAMAPRLGILGEPDDPTGEDMELGDPTKSSRSDSEEEN